MQSYIFSANSQVICEFVLLLFGLQCIFVFNLSFTLEILVYSFLRFILFFFSFVPFVTHKFHFYNELHWNIFEMTHIRKKI